MIRKIKLKILNALIKLLSNNEQFVLLVGEIVDVRMKMYSDKIKSKLNQ